MIFLIAALGATGIVLTIGGLPPFRKRRLEHRIEPYLSGLHGRPSRLLVRPTASMERLVAGPYGRTIARFAPMGDGALEDRLRSAGDERSAAAFRMEQLAWAAIGALLTWLTSGAALASGVRMDLRVVPVLTVISAAAGFMARDWLLSHQIEARRGMLQEELPMAIDLVTLSIMAGESVPAAFGRVATHLSTGIGSEFQRVTADIRAGSTTIDALESMKERVLVPGVGRFVDALCTAVERGAPLADVLRAQAEDGREARRRHLLEVGGRREVLMLVPVVFLIMPVVVVFALLPGLVSLDLLVP